MYDQIVTSLPAYACPRFLRIQVILQLQILLLNVKTRTKRWVSSKILLSPLDNVWILFILINFKNKKQKDTELMLFNAVLGVAGEGCMVKCWVCLCPSCGVVLLLFSKDLWTKWCSQWGWQANIVSCTYLLKTVEAICLKLGFTESTSKWLQGVNRTWSNLSLSKFPPAPLYSP